MYNLESHFYILEVPFHYFIGRKKNTLFSFQIWKKKGNMDIATNHRARGQGS